MQDRSKKLREAYAAEITRLAGVRTRGSRRPSPPCRARISPGRRPGIRLGRRLWPRVRDDLARLYEDVLVAIDAAAGSTTASRRCTRSAIDALGPERGRDGRPHRRGRRLLHRDPRPARRADRQGDRLRDRAGHRRARAGESRRATLRSRSAPARASTRRCPRPTPSTSTPPRRIRVRAWLDALKVGGRLLFPLQAAHSTGAMLLDHPARTGRRLAGAILMRRRVHRLRRRPGRAPSAAARRGVPPRRRGSACARCRFGAAPARLRWLQGDGWALSTEAAGEGPGALAESSVEALCFARALQDEFRGLRPQLSIRTAAGVRDKLLDFPLDCLRPEASAREHRWTDIRGIVVRAALRWIAVTRHVRRVAAAPASGADLERGQGARRAPLRRQRGLAGLLAVDDRGAWSGFDVDFCRAIAAAIFGDPNKVRLVPLTADARFQALKDGKIDVLSRNSTWTMGRETEFGLTFVGVTYYDGQGFMVSARHARQFGPRARRREGLRAERDDDDRQSRRLLLAQQDDAAGSRVASSTDESIKNYDAGLCSV